MLQPSVYSEGKDLHGVGEPFVFSQTRDSSVGKERAKAGQTSPQPLPNALQNKWENFE